jgi:aspartate/methionine/tyrosine aminotransferase
VSVLHPSVRGDSLDGVLAVFSLSKRSNLAGYRAGFVTGDPALMKDLLLVGRQAGMIMPRPVQAAMIAALSDDAHAAEQKTRYAARRAILAGGLTAAGFRIEHSEAGLYLWATRPGLDCWAACELLATECGMLVGPGSMYGPEGNDYIRVALTVTDERVATAGDRLRAFAAR